MKIFISGGAKNGKSHYAQQRARDLAEELNLPLYYVATMIPHDAEDRARIRRHIQEREGWGFETIEQGVDIHETPGDSQGVYLLDSVTALLANEMFPLDGEADQGAPDRVAGELRQFLGNKAHAVLVSDYIYGDKTEHMFKEEQEAPTEGDFTREYMKGLAEIDRSLAEISDEVVEVTAGIPCFHKR